MTGDSESRRLNAPKGIGDDEVLEAVRTHSPAATSEVADEINLTRQGAYYRLNKLHNAGRVDSKRVGPSFVWYLGDGGDGNGE